MRAKNRFQRTSFLGLALAVGLSSAVKAEESGPKNTSRGERYALLVGVGKYDPTELNALPYAEPDVEALARVLEEAGYKKENVMTMTVSASGKEPRKAPLGANIRKELGLMLKGRAKEDTVLIAFAGHGVQFKDDEEHFFCPGDAKLKEPKSLLPLKEIYQELESCPAGMKLLLVDACRNNPLAENSRAAPEIKLDGSGRPPGVEPPGGTAAFFSCSAGQKAYEDKDLGHGVFFHHVIEGLQGAAARDGATDIYLSDLEFYVKRGVEAFVRTKLGQKQLPDLMSKTRGLTSLVSRPKPPASTGPAAGKLDPRYLPDSIGPTDRVNLPGYAAKDHKVERVITARRITANKPSEKGQFEPEFVNISADGSRIAFWTASGLYTIKPDGTERKLVWAAVPGNRYPTQGCVRLSPDGQQVFFQIEGPIYRANWDGSDQRKLTNSGSGWGYFRLRQFGRRIYYSRLDGIFSVDVEGTGDIREVLTTKMLRDMFEEHIGLDQFDVDELGQNIVCRVHIPKAKKVQLCAISGDGTGFRVLTPTDFIPEHISIAPDGRRVLFAALPGLKVPESYMVNWDGSGLREVYLPKVDDYGGTPAFSPDGRWLFYWHQYSSPSGPVVMNLDTGKSFQPFPTFTRPAVTRPLFAVGRPGATSADFRRFCYVNDFYQKTRQVVVCDLNPTKAEGFPQVSDIEFAKVVSTNPDAPNHTTTMKARVKPGAAETEAVYHMLSTMAAQDPKNPRAWWMGFGWDALPGDHLLTDDGKRGDEKSADGVFTTNAFGPVHGLTYKGKYSVRIVAHDGEDRAVIVDVSGVEIK